MKLIKPAMSRRSPYTAIGIRRVQCARCTRRKGYATWQICALGCVFIPLCKVCDVAMNRLVLRWMKWQNATAILRRYKAKVESAP